jgi:hypothetical protein
MRTVGILALVFFVGAAYAATSTKSGYLDGPDDYEKWDLNLNNKIVDVVFTWPLGAEYWVTVYGMYGDELGTFNLVEGETIQLSGGGKFTIKIFSDSGSGSWTATWDDEG